jgi:NAD(P)-dependent dehydrogenase (short-subunit alcohol dehydrogenase family)
MGKSAGDRPVVLVTGAGSGIGRAIADRFDAAGWRVHVGDSDPEAVRQFLDEMPAASASVADVSRVADVETMFSDVRARYGRLDVLVNNAGISGPTAPVEEISPADWDRTIAVDLNGQFYCARLAVPLLRPPVAARSCSFLRARPFSGIHSGRRTRHASGRSSAS